MYDYKLMEAFCSVIENGGFEKAAKQLFITQSAVSQRIKLLEEETGQVLMIRSNPPEPTKSGREIMAHYKKVKLLEHDLTNSLHISDDEKFSTVPIGLNADTLTTWFLDTVADLVKSENILLDLRVDDQEETHRMLKDGEVSACISTRDKAMQSCSVHKIGTMTYRMFARSSEAEKHFKDGLTIESLKNFPVVVYNQKDTLHLQMFEKIFGVEPEEYHKMFVPSVEEYFRSVSLGLGIGMMPMMQCRKYLESGLLADISGSDVKAELYFHRWNVKSDVLNKLTNRVLKAKLF